MGAPGEGEGEGFGFAEEAEGDEAAAVAFDSGGEGEKKGAVGANFEGLLDGFIARLEVIEKFFIGLKATGYDTK